MRTAAKTFTVAMLTAALTLSSLPAWADEDNVSDSTSSAPATSARIDSTNTLTTGTDNPPTNRDENVAANTDYGDYLGENTLQSPDDGLTRQSDTQATPVDASVPVYKLYSPWSGLHLLTISTAERDALIAQDWYYEGVAWYAPSTGDPVYRLYNSSTGDHHYTSNTNEYNSLLANGWKNEGPVFYASQSAGELSGVSVFRLFHSSGAGEHYFTTSILERDTLVANGWRSEGEAFIVGAEGVGQAWPSGAPARITTVDVYRAYNPRTGEHLITSNIKEITTLVNKGWYDEGIAWRSPSWSSKPVYRLFHRASGDHLLSMDANEISTLTRSNDWANEGVVFYSSVQKEIPVYRTYNSKARVSAHLYTADTNEVNSLLANGWKNEGAAWYVKAQGKGKAWPKPTQQTYQNPSWMYQISTDQVSPRYPGSGAFAYVSPNKLKPGATRNDVVEAFVQRAAEYIGTRYVWDYALAPGQGVDCAGLVLQAMYAIGMNPSYYNPYDHYYTPGHDHYANDMRNDSRIMKVAYSQRQRGDLVFYSGHVAIYIGDNLVIDALPNGGVQIRSINASGLKVLAIGRLIY